MSRRSQMQWTGEKYLSLSLNRSVSSDSEDDDFLNLIAANAELAGTLEDDDETMRDGALPAGLAIRSKNEISGEAGAVDVTHISIDPNAPLEKLGVIEKVMGSIAIVRAQADGEYRVLDEGSIVVSEARKVLGTVPPPRHSFLISQVSETFGPVKDPRYVVRLAEQRPCDLLIGETMVCYA